MFFTLLAAERSLAEAARVEHLCESDRATKALWSSSVKTGTNKSRLLPQDDLARLDGPGGHHVPAVLLAVLHGVGLDAGSLVVWPSLSRGGGM